MQPVSLDRGESWNSGLSSNSRAVQADVVW